MFCIIYIINLLLLKEGDPMLKKTAFVNGNETRLVVDPDAVLPSERTTAFRWDKS